MAVERVGRVPQREPGETRAWVVRGYPHDVGSMVEYNRRNDVVTLGWESYVVDAPRAAFSNEEMLRDCLDQPGRKSSDKETAFHDLWYFCNEIDIDDYVVLPSQGLPKEDQWIVVGRVTNDAIHDVGMGPGARLRRDVEWLTDRIPKFEARIDKIDARRWSVVSLDLGQVMGVLRRFSKSGYMTGDEAGVWSSDEVEFPEGAKKRVEVNRYERDPEARRLRLEHDDYTCQVCDLRFEDRYGEFAREYMHVHHVVPLSQIADHENHVVDPLTDLVAVCPNCHAMLHHHPDKPCTVEKLKQEMNGAQK